jgi:AcrR family transcriptional regulator
MPPPAYTRLPVDERRRQVVEAGSELFAEHSFEEISMRQIAEAAGISKSLLYHYFPSKTELFKAAVEQHATELQELISPTAEGAPLEQLASSLDAYLAWVDRNSRTWSKLLQSAHTLPEAREIVQRFQDATLEQILTRLTTNRTPRPALRIALSGWLGFMDQAILDWTEHRDLSARKLRDLLLDAFGSAIATAVQVDPRIRLRAG